MEEARRLHGAGWPPGTTVMAGYQRSGRGRFPERRWRAARSSSLLCTILLPLDLPFAPQRLPVLIGLALARTLEGMFGIPARIKWPNDLTHEGRKLAGILCEARAEEGGVILAGIGLNVNQRRFPRELASTARSLRQILGRRVEIAPLVERLLREVRAALEDPGWHPELNRRLLWLGEPVVVDRQVPGAEAPRRLQGELAGLGEDGCLLLRLEGGRLERVVSGQLGPASPPQRT